MPSVNSKVKDAGKGSKPRPVKGEKFRRNWARINWFPRPPVTTDSTEEMCRIDLLALKRGVCDECD